MVPGVLSEDSVLSLACPSVIEKEHCVQTPSGNKESLPRDKQLAFTQRPTVELSDLIQAVEEARRLRRSWEGSS